jgi:hypothetical protein
VPLLFTLLFSCNSDKKKQALVLYNDYCASCHLAPSIQSLPKQLWANQVLPEMGARMGIRDSTFNPYEGLSYDEYEAVLKSGIYTPAPIIQEKEWKLLKDYIIQQAPDSLKMPENEIMNKSLSAFIPTPVSIDAVSSPLFTFLNIDGGSGAIKLGDMKGVLSTYDFIHDTLAIDGNFSRPITAYNTLKNVEYITAVGVLNPTELVSGKIFRVYDKQVTAIPEILHRPVHTLVEDLNNDGIDEIIVSEFGYLTGSLSLLKQKDGDTFEKQILMGLPGAIRVIIKDMNADGKKDIVALFSQGDESITIFYQGNNLSFRSEKVIRFSPIYGSSWFDLIDFDNDGDDDLVTVHGDNADKTFTPKPYHGLRLHINLGNNRFEEKYFYPLNGATRVVSRDFDQDGDIDFGILSTFPDYENPNASSFVYLENINAAAFEFEDATFKESTFGRWLLMDAGDVDGDGDEDIVLSAFSYEFTPVPEEKTNFWNKKGTDLMILENKLY